MNNSSNQIEGIGLIKNRAYITDIKYSIYNTDNYNRYVYKGSCRLDRETIERYNSYLVEVLEYILFKEKTHLKRGSGFIKITKKLFDKEICIGIGKEEDFKNEITKIFKMHILNNLN
jgi:hypothetical protein